MNTPIYMSNSFNDVPTEELEKSIQTISFIGDIDCDKIYMDLFGGWIKKDEKTKRIPYMQLNLLKLK